MERNVKRKKTKFYLTRIPQNILRDIFYKCEVRELGRLSQTCHYFQELITDRFLWKHLCWRDYNLLDPDLGPMESHYMLYKKLLHKYGWMIGTYLICYWDIRGLGEIKYRDGTVVCVDWVIEKPGDPDAPLVENVMFKISGDSSEYLCRSSPGGHMSQLSFNKVRGTVTQTCSYAVYNPQRPDLSVVYGEMGEASIASPQHVYGCILGRNYKPILLPSPDSIPNELKMNDGSIPSRLITPGIFKGINPLTTVAEPKVLCFRYKNAYEIMGHEVVTRNSFKDGIGLKIFVQKALFPSLDEQKSFEALLDCESEHSVFRENLSQPFILPEGCHVLGTYPSTCKARYEGFLRIVGSSYAKVHVIVFSDDLIGVLKLDCYNTLLTLQRVHQKFTPNILTEVESAV